jgi:hypothetical protein
MTELLAALEGSAFSTWVREASTLWAYPMIITMHTFGLGVLVGASTAIDLRVLGAAPRIPLSSLRGVFAVLWAGFALNAVTGAMLFAADPRTTLLFGLKMLSILAGVLLVVLLHRTLYRGGGEVSHVAPVARTYAILSILTWVIATTTGRLMAYL